MSYYCGIDALKIIAMLFITILHILGHGGVLESSDGTAYNIGWFIETMCFCGVNCYAIISGFLGYGKKHQFARYFSLWLQVVFYGLIITSVFFILKVVGASDVVKSLLPVTFNQYWYFSAYTGLFLIMPLIDKLVEITKNKNLLKIFGGSGLLSCYAVIAGRWSDPFRLNDGYSFVWLAILYFMGAAIKKLELHKKINSKRIGFGIVLLFLITYGWIIFIGKILGHGLDNLFVSYVSPTILGLAIGLVLIFANMEIKWRGIPVLASATFGVYLFQDNGSFSKYFLTDRFVYISQINPLMIAPAILLIAIILFAVGLIADKTREMIFKIVRVKELMVKLDALLESGFNKLIVKFSGSLM